LTILNGCGPNIGVETDAANLVSQIAPEQLDEKYYDDKRHTFGYNCIMKPINWNTEKNIRLKLERGVSFEEVLAAMSHGALLDVVSHPNTEQYPNQCIFVVRIRGYAYLVPFVETDKEVFLKTIMPSRIATKKYLTEGTNHGS